MKRILYLILLLCVFDISYADSNEKVQPIFNKAPLKEVPYAQLPLGEIEPLGWLREQMRTLLNNMTGNLDTVYERIVGDNNAWLGGEGDAWERGPYWVDGALPMAYIMNDDKLKEKCQKWVEAILKGQKENGYFGPDTDRPYFEGMQRNNSADWWPRMVALKILQQYYMATGDKRVIDFMTRYFEYQAEQLPKKPLGFWTFWATERGGDNLLMIHWLYNITGNKKLLDLGELVYKQTADWVSRFTVDNHLYRQNSLHCVNLAQGFKTPVVYYQQSCDTNNLQAPHEALRRIRHTIGFPTGLWAGDELLHFGEPTRGSELCTAAEMMYSLEEMYRITGDNTYADLLERIAYNALPTQITDSGDARQYYQQINQVEITRKLRNFSTPHEDTDILFGILTGYPCCTCNLHQAWPKFTQNLWYKTINGGLAAMIYAPSKINTILPSGAEVMIEESTGYPFEEEVRFSISLPKRKHRSVKFPLELRIPEWCQGYSLTLNGKAIEETWKNDGTICIERTWNDGDNLVIAFDAIIKVSRWYDNSAVIERGPLIYSLRMEEIWSKRICNEAERSKWGNYYYEVTSPTEWNIALNGNDIKKENIAHNFKVERTQITDTPWSLSGAPIRIKTKGIKIKDWEIERNSVGAINYMTQMVTPQEMGEDVDIILIPYGCTTLRITEFPVRRK